MLPAYVRHKSLEDKSTLFPSKRRLDFPLSLVKEGIYLGTHLKEELTDMFSKLLEYSLFPQAD